MPDNLKTFRIALLALLTMFVTSLSAQTVKGNVKDAAGEDIIGVTVQEKGTKNIAVTDIDGNFTIKTTGEKPVLTFSYIGMKNKEVSVAGKATVNIVMEDEATALEDVVVVGYGTMKKTDLTGSVSSLSTEDLTAKGAPTVMEGLQGAVPGVNITKSSGRAGGDFDIEIRGKSSIKSSTKPIYVVDGMICDDINFLNQQDIERIDVLKDASSTAIYGSRATAGVVMVTTKGGATTGKKAQKPTISYDGYYGISKVARMPDFQNAQDFYRYRFSTFNSSLNKSGNPVYGMPTGSYERMALVDANGVSVVKQALANGQVTNWRDLVTRDGSQQNHYIAVSGASDKVNYHMGLGYNEEKGIYEGDKHDQFSFKGSLDAQINKYVTAGFNVNLAYIRNEYANDDAIKKAYKFNPLSRPYSTVSDATNGYIYDANGNIPEEGYTGYYYNANGQILKNYYPGSATAMGTGNSQNFSNESNPLYLMDSYIHKKQGWRALGNVYLQIKPIKELTFKTTFSPNFSYEREGEYSASIYDNNGTLISGTGAEGYSNRASLSTTRKISYTWDNVLTFEKTFAKIHAVNLMGLFSMTANDKEATDQAAYGVLDNSLWYNLSSGDNQTDTNGSSFSESSMISYALRANYTYDERYMLTATVRWDGSSKFAEGNRWGCFPSMAVAWRASQEKFLQNIKWLSNLKLRLSYGVTGNNSWIGAYDTQVTVSGPVYYPFGSSYVSAFYPSGIVDKNLSWETSREWNFGIDFGFLNNRIYGSLDLYQKTADDLLYEVNLPLEAGTNSDGDPVTVTTNVGKVQNRGIEFSLTAVPIETRDWHWEVTAGFARNINKVKEINGSGSDLPDASNNKGLFIGQSVNNVYGYNWCGIVTDKNMTVPNNEAAIKNGFTPGETVKESDYYYKVYNFPEGCAIIEDVDGDGTIDDTDRRVWSADPSWTGSLTTSVSYKNWDLSASIYAKQHYKVYSDFLANNLDYKDRGWQHINVDYYIPAGTLIDCDGINTDGTYINPVYQQTTHYGSYPFTSDEYTTWGAAKYAFSRDGEQCNAITDASFVKVKYITLGYTFPKKWINKIGINHLRLYCTVTNPFVFTDYKGYDPEWAGGGAKNDGPSTVTWEFGASLKF